MRNCILRLLTPWLNLLRLLGLRKFKHNSVFLFATIPVGRMFLWKMLLLSSSRDLSSSSLLLLRSSSASLNIGLGLEIVSVLYLFLIPNQNQLSINGINSSVLLG